MDTKVHLNKPIYDIELNKKITNIEKMWWLILSAVFILGVYSIIDGFLLQGMSSTNLSNTVPWGGWVAFYIYFIGMSAGSFLLSTLVYGFGMEQYEKIGRSALLSAIVSMITALTFIFLDLGRPDHVFNSVIYWNVTSTMSWEIHFYIVYLILLVTELYLTMRGDLFKLSKTSQGVKSKIYQILVFNKKEMTDIDKGKDRKLLKILGIIGIPLAIFGVHGGTGSIFAVLKARPFLNSGLFPIIFILSALVSGTALAIAIYVIKNKVLKKPIDVTMVKALGGMLALFLAIELGLEWYEFLIGSYGLQHEELATMKLMTTSTWSWSFWLFQMGLAMVFPLTILFVKKTRQSVNWILAAAIMTILGVVGVRFNMVVPSLIVPQIEGLPQGNYYPNLSEWITTIGLIAMCLLIYSIGEKLLPIEENEISESGVSKHE
ncbi:NrfD/PsrC family molybdoenzyme membrane anchor subunit [Mesobacillus stamsii]|uniref:Molybdopterin-containing oxidoreductase family membrane subunit n=1 Tax=Mesobacillus stamsii TaxID=225347 RepID=A0ABU0G116_9BACI|nr:NrfD/PsrC family molybdoenzyme membrane anchor subunit [Mesobacillus stamsii]MDQ0415269.1 molybdopterin-containing oxidoreductase family membrane subunit [Mesobacillus stamsii]